MLILPPGHAEAVSAHRRLSSRERWILGGVLGTLVAIALVLVISLSSGGPSSTHGCIYATIAGDVGAQQINQCGTQARDTCQSVYAPGAYTQQAAGVIAAECRKAGLPVGSQG
ncbi:MAG TPA: hypothetical protein VMA77_25355 [Solirubrobacteraceae bacterium]|nr:hypothetical protein [Solirubrobacteraceae bacterium]